MASRTAVLETTKGTIRFLLDEENAPITTSNFIALAQRGFYDGLSFHRYVPNFVVQGGDPSGTGTGNSGKTIELEDNQNLKHDAAGVVAMARSAHPDSASCQFYITLAPTPFLDRENAQDGYGYAAFGKVTEGLDHVLELREGDKMTKVTIE